MKSLAQVWESQALKGGFMFEEEIFMKLWYFKTHPDTKVPEMSQKIQHTSSSLFYIGTLTLILRGACKYHIVYVRYLYNLFVMYMHVAVLLVWWPN